MTYKILVVEDDKNMSTIISSILKKEGYRIDRVSEGKQAIEKIKTKDYDLITLDYKLPDINGIKVLEEVRRIKPFLKVIMISAYGSPPVKSIAKKLKVYRFMDKPFDLNRFVQIVRGALAKKSQGDERR
ncbi:MAG: response regulator [Nitrospirota bacterium]